VPFTFDSLVNGTFSMSYIFASTNFDDSNPLKSGVFRRFSDTRRIISRRFAEQNPEVMGAETVNGDYRNGYVGSNQDVLIVSLLASYGLVSPEKIELSSQPKWPLPNWNLNFNATQTFPGIKAVFNQLTFKHGYRGTYTVGQFNNNLNYIDLDMDGFADVPDTVRVDTLANGQLQSVYNYYAREIIQAVQLTDQFTPLIGVNFTTSNNISGQIEYKRGRQFTLNIGNLQLVELKSQELRVSMGWRKDKLNLNFTAFGRDFNFQNSLNAQLSITMRDLQEINHTLSPVGGADQATLPSQYTRGALQWIVNPFIEYAVNKRLNVRLFTEYNFNQPYTANSYTTAFTSVGVQELAV